MTNEREQMFAFASEPSISDKDRDLAVRDKRLYKSDKCRCLDAATNDILTMKSLILAQDER